MCDCPRCWCKGHWIHMLLALNIRRCLQVRREFRYIQERDENFGNWTWKLFDSGPRWNHQNVYGHAEAIRDIVKTLHEMFWESQYTCNVWLEFFSINKKSDRRIESRSRGTFIKRIHWSVTKFFFSFGHDATAWHVNNCNCLHDFL